MAINTTAARITTIVSGITGITSAWDVYDTDLPNLLRDTHLPACIIIPGGANYEVNANGYVDEIRDFRMLLYVTPVERPEDVQKKANLMAPFFRRFITTFADAQKLNDLLAIQEARFVTDSGHDNLLEMGGLLYAGIEFTLMVREEYQLTVGT